MVASLWYQLSGTKIRLLGCLFVLPVQGFRPDKPFLHATEEACRLSRQKHPTYASPHTGQSKRLAVTEAFLRELNTLRIKKYKQLVSLTHMIDSAELRSFAEGRLLVCHNVRVQLVYALPPSKA